MCELFALSSRYRAEVSFSFEAFCRRGGGVAPNRHGWGVASYEGPDVSLMRETRPSSESRLADFLARHPIRTSRLISHVRLATDGEVALRNTQPFCRELGGRKHVFAHNGHVPAIHQRALTGTFRPVGDTDSEHAFCLLLARLAPLWEASSEGPPPLAARRAVVSQFAADLRPLGPANFLYSDGVTLFVHGHRRTQRSKVIEPPGLFILTRHCSQPCELDGAKIVACDQHVTLIASVPLSDETWQPLEEGQLLAIEAGVVAH